MTGPAAATQVESLPAMVHTAMWALHNARTSAQVLEARDKAAAAYDAAARFTRKKQAFDTMTATAMRLQAQALKIEARAKERLADEYDAAQARGEVATVGNPSIIGGSNDRATAADVGLRSDEIHEARRIRDAERQDPGAIERAVDAATAEGRAPTRAGLKRALGIDKPKGGAGAPVGDAPNRAQRSNADLDREIGDKIVRRMVQLLEDELLDPGDDGYRRCLADGFRRAGPEAVEVVRGVAEWLTALVGEIENGTQD